MELPKTYTPLEELLGRAGQAALDRFGSAKVDLKWDASAVTDADRAAEAILLEGLGQLYPADAVVGEEGSSREGGPRTWYIDPIDGTNAYVEGLAYWGPTIGCLDPEGIAAGAAAFPRLKEFWFAARGEGAWRNGRRLPPLEPRPIERREMVLVPSRFFRYFELDHPGKSRSLGSTAAHLCLAASGAAAATIVPAAWDPWDALAGLLLLHEVEGVALSFQGTPIDPRSDRGTPFVAGNPAAVSQVLSHLRYRGA